MKFFMAYSGGKDCTLALDRMIRQGHQCVALLVVTGIKGQYSYMHLFTDDILKQFSESLGIPIIKVPSKDKNDIIAMVEALAKQNKIYNADAVCSGDIDYIASYRYNKMISKIVGLEAIFPLWHEDRNKLLNELLDKGYICRIKCVDLSALPKSFLGKTLDKEMIETFKKRNIDICGENGEYHTMVTNGPIFKKELPFEYDYIYEANNIASLIFKTSNDKKI